MEVPNTGTILLARCHRLGGYRFGRTRPIIVKFEHFEDRMSVWKLKKAQKNVNHDVNIFIEEDFPKEIRQRSRLTPSFKAATSMPGYKRKVSLVLNRLILNALSTYYLNVCDRRICVRDGLMIAYISYMRTVL